MNEDMFMGEVREQIKSLFNRVEKLEFSNDSLKEITTILKLQQEQNSEHLKSFEKINENLTNLNSTVQTLQVDMDNVKKEVVDLTESSKIDLRQIFKQVIYVGIPTLIIGAIAYYLGKYGFHTK